MKELKIWLDEDEQGMLLTALMDYANRRVGAPKDSYLLLYGDIKEALLNGKYMRTP